MHPGCLKEFRCCFPISHYISSNSPQQSVPERKLTILDGDDIKWYQLFSRCTPPHKVIFIITKHLSRAIRWLSHIARARRPTKTVRFSYEDEKTLSCFHNGLALQTYPRFSRAKVSIFLPADWFYFTSNQQAGPTDLMQRALDPFPFYILLPTFPHSNVQ